jgi:hypothetical protein
MAHHVHAHRAVDVNVARVPTIQNESKTYALRDSAEKEQYTPSKYENP